MDPPSRQRTILVVDDVSVDRKLLSRTLEKEGYQVSLAYDGRQALQLLRAQHEIDLVLIDVNMPVMNGFETLSRIKSSPDLWHIPVILMSSDDKAEDGVGSALMRSISLGAADFLHKPINPAVLKSKLRDVFSNAAAPAPGAGKTITVLCIDDQVVVRKTVQKCLGRAGFSVECAQDGVEALELLQKKQAENPGQPPVDIILLDLFMPRMNGKELLIRLKQSNEWATIPVIIMTSDDEADTTDNMLSLGADDCLKKPLGEGLLKKRISKALESNRLRMWVAKLWPGRQYGEGMMDGSAPLHTPAAGAGGPTIITPASSGINGMGMGGVGVSHGHGVVLPPPLPPSTHSDASSVASSSSFSSTSSTTASDVGFVDSAAATSPDEAIIAKNPTPPLQPGDVSMSNGSSSGASSLLSDSSLKSAHSRPPAAAPPGADPYAVAMSRKDWENYEKLKSDNKEFRRRLKDKMNKVQQLEGVLLDASRTLEAERATTQQLQRQIQSMTSHERELRIQLTQMEQRVQQLVKEAADRGYIPCLVTPKVVPASFVNQELQEVYVRAEVLFNTCPDYQMTVHREEFAALTHDVCGYPAYFARPLFERIVQHSIRAGTREPGATLTVATGTAVVVLGAPLASCPPPSCPPPSDALSGYPTPVEHISITLDDFIAFWQEAVEANLCDHIGKFWWLVRRPASDHIYPEDLRPLIKALVDYHVDLSSFRTDNNYLEAYITTVLISIFCSLHGQSESKISLSELKGSNLVDAFDLVATQSTRNIRPFCVAYFDEIFSRFKALDRRGADVIRYEDLAATRDVKITNFMLQRVFGHYPRRLTCPVRGCMSFADFVWFWLAEKDGMTDTSISYWFRCLDLDNDGYLGVEDLLSCYAMKINAMTNAGMSVSSLLSPYDVMCQIMDAINPRCHGKVSCLDLKRCNNAAVLFDVFVGIAYVGTATVVPNTED